MFIDRQDAGPRLGAALRHADVRASVVLGLPRGGVPVAAEVAAALDLPLDVIVVRKLGLPTHPEVAMGSIGEDGVRLLDPGMIRDAGVSRAQLDDVESRERETLDRRARLLRGGAARRDLTGQAVLIVDDGIATGATASAACLVARRLGAAQVVVAAPVGAPDAARRIVGADRVFCLEQPEDFRAVGASYRRFDQTTDDEVVRLLARTGTAS